MSGIVSIGSGRELPNGQRARRVGFFATLGGFFSPNTNHILCERHAERVQPLQPAMGGDVDNFPWCPYCKGGTLAGRYHKHTTRAKVMRALRSLKAPEKTR